MKFLIIILLPALIFSYEWAPPQRVGYGIGGDSRFALDCFNRLWCIFNHMLWIKVSYYIDSLWSEPESIYIGGPASGTGGFDVTRAKDGKLWVLISSEYQPVTPPHVTFYFDGTIWSDTFVIPGFTHFRLAADSIGKVWTVFEGDEDYRIWCDVCEDTVWTGPYIVCSYPTYDQVRSSNITVDPKGIRWVGALVSTSPMSQIFLCHSDSTGAWSDSIIMGPQGRFGWQGFSDMIADNEGNIWVAWVDGYEDRIYTAYLDTNLNWSPYYQITQSSGAFYGWCNLAVDDENKVWIIYDKEDNFYYRVWNGNLWSPEDSIVTSPASSAFNGAVFYDPIRDRIWVSFKTGGHDIYTTWTNPSSGIEQHPILDTERLTPDIYPNPARSFLAIRLPQTANRQTLKIYNVSGKMVREIATPSARNDGMGETKISLKGINPGIYFLRLGKQTKKVLVVK